MKNWNLTRSAILAAPVPEATRTYTPIPHRVFLEEIQEKLMEKNYLIKSEKYLTTQNFGLMTGQLILSKTGQTQSVLSPSLSMVNSYNKTRKASIQACAAVLVCKNGMLGNVSQGTYSRKHNTDALTEFRDHIDIVIDGLEKEFNRLEKNMFEMQAIKLEKNLAAQLVGDMFLNENLISATQLGILKHELQYSKDFRDGSLWSFYNNCTECFKDNHPMLYDKQHIKFHSYMSDKFSLSGHRGLYGEQLDLAIIESDITTIEEVI